MKKIIAMALVAIVILSLSVAAFAAGTKVYCSAPADWQECYVYTWDDNETKYTGDWPGTKMTKVGDLWEYEVPTGAVNVIFNNGNGGGENQTEDLKMPTDGKVVYDTVAKTWGEKDPEPTTPTTGSTTPTTSATTPTTSTTTPTTSGKNTRVMSIKAPAAWKDVYIYTWDQKDYGEWPGQKLQQSNGVYKTEIRKDMVNLVVTGYKADTSTQQTPDLVLETNGLDLEITIDDNGQATIKYIGDNGPVRFKSINKPHATKTTGTNSVYRVSGTLIGNWNPDDNKGLMVEVEKGLYRVNFENVQPGKYELKITKDGKWDVSYGDRDKNNDGSDDNAEFHVSAAGTVTVDFQLKDGNVGYIEVYGNGVDTAAPGDISMLSTVVLLVLASVTAIVLVSNKKKFI